MCQIILPDPVPLNLGEIKIHCKKHNILKVFSYLKSRWREILKNKSDFFVASKMENICIPKELSFLFFFFTQKEM